MQHRIGFGERARADHPFWVLLLLLVAAWLLGGSARDDVPSLLVLRPLAVLCLAIGLAGLTRDQMRSFRWPLTVMAALLVLILIQLIPLPPAIWNSLPGRGLAHEVATAAGVPQPWRPFAMVPWRGWNAFYAMLVPAAALVLAVRCSPEQRKLLVFVVLGLGLASAVIGVVQVVSGGLSQLYFYRISNVGSPAGVFANRNHHAAFLACLFPLLAYGASLRGRGEGLQRRGMPTATILRTWAAVCAGIFFFFLVLTTGARAGLGLAIVAMALTAVIYQPRGGGGLDRKRLIWIAGAVIAVSLLLLVAVFFSRGEAVERILNIETSDQRRFETWAPILSMAGEYFPFGSGVGSFVDIYKIYEPQQLLSPNYFNHAHNDWLEWLLEGGVGAILLFTVLIVSWVWGTVRLVRRRGEGEQARLALAGAAIILLLGLASAVDYPTRVPLIGCVLALAAVWMSSERVEMQPRAARGGARSRSGTSARESRDYR